MGTQAVRQFARVDTVTLRNPFLRLPLMRARGQARTRGAPASIVLQCPDGCAILARGRAVEAQGEDIAALLATARLILRWPITRSMQLRWR